MSVKTKKPQQPRKKKVNLYSEEYHFARKMYFTANYSPSHEIVYYYTFTQIAEMVAKEFNTLIPASTIRRWAG